MSSQRLRDFRPSSVHQHAELREPAPGARALFARLRPRLLGSRPLLEEARAVEYVEPHNIHGRDKAGNKTIKRSTFVRRIVKPEVFGAPTFRNVIDPETGAHV